MNGYDIERLRKAAEMLPEIEGMRFTLSGANGLDAQLAYGSHSTDYSVTRRESVSTTTVEILANEDRTHEILLFAPYVNPTCAERLRKHGISFLDERGHAFLRAGPLYVFISSKATGKPVKTPRKRKAFSKATLNLIYSLLTDSDGKNAQSLHSLTYRDLSMRAGISLGAVSNAMRDLETQGYLVETESEQRRLVNKKNLLERWVQDYILRVRPKLVIDLYRPPHPEWWREVGDSELPGLWGGETAGALLTQYLVPETFTIYAAELPASFVVDHDLRKDPAGSVEILRPFCPQPHSGARHQCVHPLIAYADLLASDMDRNLETAQRLYEHDLRSLVESD